MDISPNDISSKTDLANFLLVVIHINIYYTTYTCHIIHTIVVDIMQMGNIVTRARFKPTLLATSRSVTTELPKLPDAITRSMPMFYVTP